MAFGATALPKELTALLFFSFLLIHVNSIERRECWFATLWRKNSGLWCLEGRIRGLNPGECLVAGSSFVLSCRLEITAERNSQQTSRFAILPTRSMRWFKDGQEKGERTTDDNSFSNLKVESSQLGDSGNYSCRAYWKNRYFEKTISVKVLETAGKITTNQSSIRVKLHDSATLSCHVKGHSPSNFMWTHTGIEGVRNLTSLGITSSVDSTNSIMTLRLKNVTLDMQGIYECRARSCLREFTNSINLTVFDIPKVTLDARAVGPSSVFLKWTLDGDNDPTKLSAVRQTQMLPGPLRYVKASITNSSLPGVQNASIVNNLNNNTTYKFEVVFNTSAGDSFPTYSEWVTTLDKDFDFVPKLAIEGVTTNSIEVRASLPPVELLDLVSHYELTLTDSEGIERLYHWMDIHSAYTVTNLEKGTSYKLQVAACNAYLVKCGKWYNREELVSTAAKELNFIPQIQVKTTTNNSISIGWEKPSLAQYYQISQYKMEATSGDDKTGTIELNRTADSYVFQNLKSNMTYEIRITVCIFGSGKCKDWSAPVKADTINRDPKFVPTVSVCGTTSDSVVVVWTTPPEELRDPVQQYKVEATNKNETQGPVFLRNDMSSHTFGNLTSGTTYQLRVAACSIYTTQCGDWSEAKNATTINQDPDPDFTPKLEIEGVTLDSIDVRAPSLPVELQGWVDDYHVMVTDSEGGKQLHNWTNIDSTFSIRNLTSETSYGLRVAACNTCLGKCGNWSDEIEVSTAGKEFNYKANISVKATKTDSIKIGWNEPSPAEMYQILRYIVRATYENGTREQNLDRTTVSFIFEHLQPNATYEFGLTVCIYGSEDCDNNYQSAAVRADARNRDPIFVPSVSVDKTTYDSVWVVWTMPPEELRDRVARYKVQANNGNETRGPVSLPNYTNSHVFGGLEPQTTFQFQVAACGIYEEQCGNWSETENGTTIAKAVTSFKPLINLPAFIGMLWPSLVVVAVVMVIAMGVWVCLRKRRQKAKIRQFKAITLHRLNREALDSLEPESDVVAQAEPGPYD